MREGVVAGMVLALSTSDTAHQLYYAPSHLFPRFAPWHWAGAPSSQRRFVGGAPPRSLLAKLECHHWASIEKYQERRAQRLRACFERAGLFLFGRGRPVSVWEGRPLHWEHQNHAI